MAVELDEIGIAIKSGKPSVETSHLSLRIKHLRESFIRFRDEQRTAENVEGFIGMRHILDSIQDIADRLHTLHGYTTYDWKLGKNFRPQIDYDQFITHQGIESKLLLENLTLTSNIFRHSLRVSIATLAGYLISQFFPLGHGYWILLTITVILKPAYSLTKKRNFERLMGTLAGAFIGLLILYFIGDRTVLFVLMILFMMGTYVFLRTNYLICVTLMTPYVLLLFHLLYPHDFRTILSDRVIDTVIGSAIAFIANIFLVPSREREQITDYMIRIIEANGAYFRDVSGAFLGKPVSVARYKLSRKHAFVALANLSDAFDRILSEPGNKRKLADRMHQFVVSSHMLTSHIATLAYYTSSLPGGEADPAYGPIIRAMLMRLDNTAACLQEKEGYGGAGSGEAVTGKEELRILNGKMTALMNKRKAELEKGILESDTRRQLSGFKPIVDQFNFIAKVTADIGKIGLSLRPEALDAPAAPASSLAAEKTV
jgi:uncharacterized membrane protein YccC